MLIPMLQVPSPPFLLYYLGVNGTKKGVVYGEGRVETEGSVAGTTFFLQGRSQATMRLIPIAVVPASPLHLPT